MKPKNLSSPLSKYYDTVYGWHSDSFTPHPPSRQLGDMSHLGYEPVSEDVWGKHYDTPDEYRFMTDVPFPSDFATSKNIHLKNRFNKMMLGGQGRDFEYPAFESAQLFKDLSDDDILKKLAEGNQLQWNFDDYSIF